MVKLMFTNIICVEEMPYACC